MVESYFMKIETDAEGQKQCKRGRATALKLWLAERPLGRAVLYTACLCRRLRKHQAQDLHFYCKGIHRALGEAITGRSRVGSEIRQRVISKTNS